MASSSLDSFNSGTYNRFYGGQELPKIFQKHGVQNAKNLMEIFEQKYPYLAPIINRNPTTPLYPNKTKIESLHMKFKSTSQIHFFMTWIDKEINYLTGALTIVCYGLSEFGNPLRLEIDNVKPYFYFKFPFNIFNHNHKKQLKNDISLFNLTQFKEIIEKKIWHHFENDTSSKASFNQKKIKRYQKFAKKYHYPEGTLITNIEIEWHLSAVGTNLDKPEPFIKIFCLMPELVNTIKYAVKNNKKTIQKKFFYNFIQDVIEYHDIEDLSWVDLMTTPETKNQNVHECEKAIEIYEGDGGDSMTIKFLKDHNLKSCEWWTITKPNIFEFNPQYYNVDLNIKCFDSKKITPIDDSNPIKKIFPDDVIFLFDGEMLSITKQGFPKAQIGDPIGQLGVHIIRTNSLLNRFSLQESLEKKLFYSIILTALPVPSFSSVFNNENNKYSVRCINIVKEGNDQKTNNNEMEEQTMLEVFQELFLYTNPSFTIAYNGNRFDWPYIIDRMYMLYKKPQTYDRPQYDWSISEYACFSRDFNLNRGIHHQKAKKVTTEQLQKASARTAYDQVKIIGVANMDLYLYVKQFAKYGLKSSYSLDAVALKRLGERKIEINYDFIPILFQSENGRLSIAKYCNRDVELMTRLLAVLGFMEFIYLLGQMAIVPPQQLVDRGTQYLVDGVWYTTNATYDHLSLYSEKNGLRDHFTQKFIRFKLDKFPYQTTPVSFLLPDGYFYLRRLEGPRSKGDDEKGSGADVIEPPNGKISNVGTLDFKSLYPSIMMTFFICCTTIIPHYKRQKLITKIKKIAQKFNIPKNETMYKRKENWFCTGDQPVPFQTLKDALEYLNSPTCNYPPKMKKTLDKIAHKLHHLPDSENLIKKWEPIALSQYDLINQDLFNEIDQTDENIQYIFLNVIEPICQLTGTTKVQYNNNELPAFLGKGIRMGVLAKRQAELSALRSVVKREMGAAKSEKEKLLREGVDKSDPRIISLSAKITECDIKQLAIKCIMNSIYGWLASKLHAKFSMQETICTIGQSLLENTKCFVETMGKKVLGFIGNCVIGYGDTDSVFFIMRFIENFDQMKTFLKNIRQQYESRDASLFNKQKFDLMTQHFKNEVQANVSSGVILDKFASKAVLLLQWKKIFDDFFFDERNFNTLRLQEHELLNESESHFKNAMKAWFDNLFFKDLKTDPDNLQNAKWHNIEYAPNPPLFKNASLPSPRDLRMILRWIFINILFIHGRRLERIVNNIFKYKYNGVIEQELEKIYEDIIWWRKKKYAGCLWEPGSNTPQIKASGISSVRGDCHPFKSFVCKNIIEFTLEEDDDQAAKRSGYQALKNVMDGKVGVHELIQSKNVKKDITEYGEMQKNIKRLAITKGMPIHIVGAVYRHLHFNEPLPQIDDRYYFIILKDIGNVSKGKRIVPPHVILKSKGVIDYDRLDYATGCVKQISNLLAPLFDSRSFEEKMAQAELYRRVKNKKERGKMINKWSEEQRSEIEKHFMLYVKNGTNLKDSEFIIEKNKKLLTKAKDQSDIRSFFGFSQAPSLPSSSSRDKALAIEQIADSRKNIATQIKEIVIDLEDDHQSSIIPTTSYQRFSMSEIITNMDNYSRMLPFSYSDILDEKSSSSSNNDEDDSLMPTKKRIKVPCSSCKKLMFSTSKRCSHCKAVAIKKNDQCFITQFVNIDNIQCILCSNINPRTICDSCSGQYAESMFSQIKHEIFKMQIEKDCAKCAQCFGVPAPNMPLMDDGVHPSSSSSKRSLNDNNHPPNDTFLTDIEDIVDTFYNTNLPVKHCAAITCTNRWIRNQNERRLEIIKKIEYDYYEHLNLQSNSLKKQKKIKK